MSSVQPEFCPAEPNLGVLFHSW